VLTIRKEKKGVCDNLLHVNYRTKTNLEARNKPRDCRKRGEKEELRHLSSSAAEFVGGVRPNWELPIAPAMAGLFIAHDGRCRYETSRRHPAMSHGTCAAMKSMGGDRPIWELPIAPATKGRARQVVKNELRRLSVRPNWELPVASAMAGLFIADGGRCRQKTLGRHRVGCAALKFWAAIGELPMPLATRGCARRAVDGKGGRRETQRGTCIEAT
jgi:hypothetical protein